MSRVGLAPDTNADMTPVRCGVRCFRRHRTQLDSRTRVIGRDPTSSIQIFLSRAPQLFLLFIKKIKKMLTKYEPFSFSCTFFFVISLSFPASEPNTSLAAHRRLHFPTQVGPSFSFLICSAAPCCSFFFCGEWRYKSVTAFVCFSYALPFLVSSGILLFVFFFA